MNDKPCKNCGSTDRLPPPAGCKNGPCKTCTKRRAREWASAKYSTNPKYFAAKAAKHRTANPEKFLWREAKSRSKQRGIPFNIEVEDILIPEFCPVFGKKLAKSTGQGRNPYAPSLDRIVPVLGYVKGNIRVISWRANELKRDITPEEMEMMMNDMHQLRTQFERVGIL